MSLIKSNLLSIYPKQAIFIETYKKRLPQLGRLSDLPFERVSWLVNKLNSAHLSYFCKQNSVLSLALENLAKEIAQMKRTKKVDEVLYKETLQAFDAIINKHKPDNKVAQLIFLALHATTKELAEYERNAMSMQDFRHASHVSLEDLALRRRTVSRVLSDIDLLKESFPQLKYYRSRFNFYSRFCESLASKFEGFPGLVKSIIRFGHEFLVIELEGNKILKILSPAVSEEILRKSSTDDGRFGHRDFDAPILNEGFLKDIVDSNLPGRKRTTRYLVQAKVNMLANKDDLAFFRMKLEDRDYLCSDFREEQCGFYGDQLLLVDTFCVSKA